MMDMILSRTGMKEVPTFKIPRGSIYVSWDLGMKDETCVMFWMRTPDLKWWNPKRWISGTKYTLKIVEARYI